MNIADEGALAWALADSATGFLKPADRTRLCAKIGAGEPGSAIRDLLAFYADTDAELPRELAAPVLSWIQGYSGSDSEPTLRRMYDRISVSVTSRAGRQRPETETRRPPKRLVATRRVHATRSTIAARRSTSARKHVAISGVTTSVDGLFDLAISPDWTRRRPLTSRFGRLARSAGRGLKFQPLSAEYRTRRPSGADSASEDPARDEIGRAEQPASAVPIKASITESRSTPA